jgi:hypothetical protein
VGAFVLLGINLSKLNKNLTIPRPSGFSVVVGFGVDGLTVLTIFAAVVVSVGANVTTLLVGTVVVVVVVVVVLFGVGFGNVGGGRGLGVSKNSSISVSNDNYSNVAMLFVMSYIQSTNA